MPSLLRISQILRSPEWLEVLLRHNIRLCLCSKLRFAHDRSLILGQMLRYMPIFATSVYLSQDMKSDTGPTPLAISSRRDVGTGFGHIQLYIVTTIRCEDVLLYDMADLKLRTPC